MYDDDLIQSPFFMENPGSIAGNRSSQNLLPINSEQAGNPVGHLGGLPEAKVEGKKEGIISPSSGPSMDVVLTSSSLVAGRGLSQLPSAEDMAQKKFPAAWVDAVTTGLKQATQQAAAQYPSDPAAYQGRFKYEVQHP